MFYEKGTLTLRFAGISATDAEDVLAALYDVFDEELEADWESNLGAYSFEGDPEHVYREFTRANVIDAEPRDDD